MTHTPMIGGYSVAPRTIADIKYCSGCRAHHPRSDFAQSLTNRDGLQGWCRKYSSGYAKAKRAAKDVL